MRWLTWLSLSLFMYFCVSMCVRVHIHSLAIVVTFYSIFSSTCITPHHHLFETRLLMIKMTVAEVRWCVILFGIDTPNQFDICYCCFTAAWDAVRSGANETKKIEIFRGNCVCAWCLLTTNVFFHPPTPASFFDFIFNMWVTYALHIYVRMICIHTYLHILLIETYCFRQNRELTTHASTL